MKDLKGYKMHLIKSNKVKLLFCSLIFSNLYAQNILHDDSILSEPRKNSFDLSDTQLKQESSKLKKDWINPIIYQYKKNLGEDNDTSQSLISINQPIFQSGGIYKAIKYASSTYDYSSLELEEQKKALIKKAVELLFNIEKIDLNIKKNLLSVENAKIDVQRKKEQVLNGFLDASYLDNALLALNSTKQNLIELKYQKNDFINSFNSISSKDYKNFELPKFELFSKDKFLENNLEIKKAKADIEKKDNYSYMTLARYLPSLNAYYNFSKYHDNDSNDSKYPKDSNQSFGLSLQVPFDTRSINDIESKKIDYLKAKLNLQTIINDEEIFFKTNLQKLEMLDERIKVTNEDLEVYNSILKIINEEKEAQLKTQSDVDTLENSQKIKLLELKMFEIDKQITLLNMYVKLH